MNISTLAPDSLLWSVPPEIQLLVASYIPQPADLYFFICRVYLIFQCGIPDLDGLDGNVLVARSGANRRASYDNNLTAWEWAYCLRQELGERIKARMCSTLRSMGVAFLQHLLEIWNLPCRDITRSHVFLSGSVPLCVLNGIIPDPLRSDLDLFVSDKVFDQVTRDLAKRGFRRKYRSRNMSYSGLLKWRVYRYEITSDDSDDEHAGSDSSSACVDLVRIDSTCLDGDGYIRTYQLASSFDMSGCAVSYNGYSTIIPSPEATLGSRLLLRMPYPKFFGGIMDFPHRICSSRMIEFIGMLGPSIVHRSYPFQNRPNSPFLNESNLVSDYAWALYAARKVIERIIKYRRRGFVVVGCPYYHGLLLIDVSLRIQEFRESRQFRMHYRALSSCYYVRQLLSESKYLQDMWFEYAVVLAKFWASMDDVEDALCDDAARGEDAWASERLYRLYLHIRLLSRVQVYLKSRPAPSAESLWRSVGQYRRAVIKAYERLPELEQLRLKGRLDPVWLRRGGLGREAPWLMKWHRVMKARAQLR